MSRRGLLLASAIGLCISTPLRAADPQLVADAKAFGARQAVVEPDLSPDGMSVVYITPGPGRRSVAVVGNLDTGKFTQMAASDGNGETLRWCHFVAAARSVCDVTGLDTKTVGEIIGFSRLMALDTDGSHPKLLGQSQSAYDAYMRQFDASVIDWLQGAQGKVLLERAYVPEEY
jgi:hypothetical protein